MSAACIAAVAIHDLRGAAFLCIARGTPHRIGTVNTGRAFALSGFT